MGVLFQIFNNKHQPRGPEYARSRRIIGDRASETSGSNANLRRSLSPNESSSLLITGRERLSNFISLHAAWIYISVKHENHRIDP